MLSKLEIWKSFIERLRNDPGLDHFPEFPDLLKEIQRIPEVEDCYVCRSHSAVVITRTQVLPKQLVSALSIDPQFSDIHVTLQTFTVDDGITVLNEFTYFAPRDRFLEVFRKLFHRFRAAPDIAEQVT